MFADIVPVHAGSFCVLHPPGSFLQIYLLLQLSQRQGIIEPGAVHRIVQLLPLLLLLQFQKMGKCLCFIQFVAQLGVQPGPPGFISKQSGAVPQLVKIPCLIRKECLCQIMPEVALRAAALTLIQLQQVTRLLKLACVEQSLGDIVDMALPPLLAAS